LIGSDFFNYRRAQLTTSCHQIGRLSSLLFC
jgi:hypothetical protein